MANIKQLPETVANQISAGEVIERPASVVKELIENSLDAGSDRILVEVDNGGKDRIRVRDNGQGIASEDMRLAFSRYATSKIESVNDIYSLTSLGFRGEALASIASVSRVRAVSRPEGANSGTLLEIKGSEVVTESTTGCPVGTDITVTELFFNTPARYKYLKTTRTEFSHISEVVTREALGAPGVSLRLHHNQKQRLQTHGTGSLKETIHALYGRELTDNLLPVDFEDRYIKITGYIARPSFYRSSRVYENFFVNQRPVYSNVVARGVEAGYQGLLPPGKYPACFLYLKLNPVLIDVNVHPTKRKVKFSRNKIIQDVIKKGVRQVLEENDPSPTMNIEQPAPNRQSRQQPAENQSSLNLNAADSERTDSGANRGSEAVNGEQGDHSKQGSSSYNRDLSSSSSIISEDRESDYIEPLEPLEEEPEEGIPIRKILGQLHNTYIITEVKDGMYIIDQHTAGERIIFDQLREKYNNSQVGSQQLLVPVNIELTVGEMEVIDKYQEEINRLGLGIEKFGNSSIVVREVPVIMKKRSSKNVVKELIDNFIKKGQSLKPAELIREIILYMGCHHAVKAGDRLARQEMKQLIKDLFATSNPYRCPHGRPIILHFSNHDLERGMGRT
ncbi:MAG: DNA mismatch repair endonuclease MutL [Bacillota bacterium]